jgi:hypothetical protein
MDNVLERDRRACPGFPRPSLREISQAVDARREAGHDESVSIATLL